MRTAKLLLHIVCVRVSLHLKKFKELTVQFTHQCHNLSSLIPEWTIKDSQEQAQAVDQEELHLMLVSNREMQDNQHSTNNNL
jgi:transposase